MGAPAGASTTTIEIVAELLPLTFVAVIVTLTAAAATVGVPEITPVELFSVNPVGKVPEVTLQVVAAPPVFVGDADADVPTGNDKGDVYEMAGGLESITVRVRIAVSLIFDAFVAVTVKVVAAKVALAEPVITPVEMLNVRPAGKVGEINQVEIAPPVLAGAEIVPKEF